MIKKLFKDVICKKIICVSLALLMCMMVTDISFADENVYTISLASGITEVYKDSDFNVDVQIASEVRSEFTNADLEILYDSTKVKYKGAVTSDMVKVTSSEYGHILISDYGIKKQLTDGKAKLVTLTFTALGAGSAGFSIADGAETGDGGIISEKTGIGAVCSVTVKNKESQGGGDSSGNVDARVWDGRSIDVSWFDKNTYDGTDDYYIETPAQFAGLAALVNGIYNKEIDTIKGDKSAIVDNFATSGTSSGPQGSNKSTPDYHYGSYNFKGKTIYLTADIDMGDSNYMPVGGQYLMRKNNYNTKISSSFCGMLDGQGHSITINCDRHCSTGNYGDGASVGLIGLLGLHDNDPADERPSGAGICDLAVYGSVYANRSVGGIVGKIGKTADGAVIERCANYADVKNTDSKGVGGIAGSGWNGGVIRDCYNAGNITSTYASCPVGGISGSNEIQLENCYSYGKITALKSSFAMGIGTNNGGAPMTYVKNCWYLKDSASGGYYTNNKADDSGAMTDAEMKEAEFVDTLGDAFSYDSHNINNGYPVLKWQKSGADKDSGGSGGTGGNTGQTTQTLPFDDIDNHWAKDSIGYIYKYKLINGISATKFAPDRSLSRAMLVTVLYRLDGEPSVSGSMPFSDVPDGSWYSKAVLWASQHDIVKGYGDGRFAPEASVTREEMAAIFMRYASYKGVKTESRADISGYTDKDKVASWALEPVEWSVSKGLIKGRTAEMLAPKGTTTRAETAAVLERYMKNVIPA